MKSKEGFTEFPKDIRNTNRTISRKSDFDYIVVGYSEGREVNPLAYNLNPLDPIEEDFIITGDPDIISPLETDWEGETDQPEEQ